MSKKTISNPIANELKGSAWFKRPDDDPPKEPVASKKKDITPPSTKPQPDTPRSVTPRHRDTMTPRAHDTTVSRHHDTATPRHRDTTNSETEWIVEEVAPVGTESGTRRLTVAEKQALDKIKFDYRNRKLYTSENEIMRIALHYLLAEYRQNKEGSVLHQVLMALHSKPSKNK